MKYQRIDFSHSPQRQRGIATVLMVVLVGLALTATAIGIMHSMRATQEKNVAVHAVTHAQTGVWAGAEAFRLYLDSLTTSQLESLSGNMSMSLGNNAFGSMSIQNVSVTPVSGGHQVRASLINAHGDARASAAVEVVYEVTAAGSGEYQLSGPLNFNDDLSITSRLVLDNPMVINVKGDVNIRNADITNLAGINATGSVTVVGNQEVNLGVIHANGDVHLSETGVSAQKIKAMGEVTLEDEASVPEIEANDNVTHNAESDTTSMRSRKDVTVGNSSGNHNLITAGGGVTINSGYSGTVSQLWSVENIKNNSATARLIDVYGEKDLDCPANWNNFSTISLKGDFSATCVSPLSPAAGQTVNRPANVTVNVMTPVSSFTMPTLAVDVYPYREEANYLLSYQNDKIQVDIKNVYGLTNGTYYVGEGHKICTDVGANNACIGDTGKYMCLGTWAGDTCVTYRKKKSVFVEDANKQISRVDHDLPTNAPGWQGTFDVSGVAPGIWWIDGHVVFGTGFNNGTIMATGNIASKDHYRGAAVNYGGEPIVYSDTIRDPSKRTTPYQEICQAIGTGMKGEMDHLRGIYTPRFENQYPTNLCDKTEGTFTAHRLGNIALAAGGIRPVSLGGNDVDFTGGDIFIHDNSNVFGIILAGGYLEIRDNVAIMGYVSASVLGGERADEDFKNRMDADVKVYTDTATEYYSPNQVPWMGANPCTVGCGPNSGEAKTKLLWSRYL